MRNFVLKIIQWKLKILASLYLFRYKPRVIAVTGSVGKSSTKEAIYTILRNHFKTRRSQGSYNNEIGVPLTIIGSISPGANIFGWFTVFIKGLLGLINDKNYPEILVLEMGVDRIGDLDYLLSFIDVDIAVITKICGAHLETMKSVEEIFKEKTKLAHSLKKGTIAILNFDDRRLQKLGIEIKRKVIFYGFDKSAHIYASEISQEADYISFNVNWSGSSVPAILRTFGKSNIYSALAACACAIEFGVDLITSSKEIQTFKGLKGRMKKFKGIKGSTIFDDSYNSNPTSVLNAFETITDVAEKGKLQRILLVLGDMLELGKTSKRAHLNIGREAAKIADLIVAVGEEAKNIYSEAEIKLGQNAHWFKDSDTACAKVPSIIKKGDLVLIKGSQGVRMEKISKRLLKNTSDIKRLPRMSSYWKK